MNINQKEKFIEILHSKQDHPMSRGISVYGLNGRFSEAWVSTPRIQEIRLGIPIFGVKLASVDLSTTTIMDNGFDEGKHLTIFISVFLWKWEIKSIMVNMQL